MSKEKPPSEIQEGQSKPEEPQGTTDKVEVETDAGTILVDIGDLAQVIMDNPQTFS